MNRLLTIASLCISLGGCVSINEQRNTAAMARIAAQDDTACQSYGAKPGADSYVTCRTSLQAGRLSAPNITVAGPVANPAPFNPQPPVTCMRTGNMTTCN